MNRYQLYNRTQNHRNRFWLLLLLVALSTAAREIPELLTLTDDVSNDGTIVSVWQDSGADVSLQRSSLQATHSFTSFNLFLHSFELSLSHSYITLRGAQRDLLELLVLQRK